MKGLLGKEEQGQVRCKANCSKQEKGKCRLLTIEDHITLDQSGVCIDLRPINKKPK